MIDQGMLLDRRDDCREALRDVEAELSRWGSRPGLDTDESLAALLAEQEALCRELQWLWLELSE